MSTNENDPRICRQHEARGVLIQQQCRDLETEIRHREEEYRDMMNTLGKLGERIDKATPRWAFLLLVGLLVASLGWTNVSIISLSKDMALVSQKVESHVELFKGR